MAAVTAGRRDAFWQLVRYAINGGIVTALYTVVFVATDTFTHASPQFCNAVGFVAALVFGYMLHSRVTFRDHGARGLGSQVRFAVAALPGYVVNAFWTWLFATALGWPHWTVQLPVWFVTPFLIFVINRWWVFK